MTRASIYLPALSAEMGDWQYYSTVMRMQDAADYIEFASVVNEMRDGKQLSDLIQRALKDGRPTEIAKYLVGDPEHFFNALVVAVYGGDPEFMEFDVQVSSQSRSRRYSTKIPPWAQSSFGYLHLSGKETLFALDGQHRLAGIKLAVEQKRELADEKVTVLFVSHKLTDLGRQRTRKLFTTLNKTAIPVNKSEIIALDESDTAAIITRRLVENHPYFSNGQIKTEYGATNLPASDSKYFMTIIKLYDLVTYTLNHLTLSLDRDARARLKYQRPKDDDLEKYYKGVVRFLESFINAFPELKDYFSQAGVDARNVIRLERHVNRNILFRSVGLEIFLKLLPALKNEEGSLPKAIDVLTLLPRQFTSRPYVGVLYSATEEKILSGRTRLSIRLLRYMLGFDSQKVTELRKDYAEAQGQDVSVVRLPNRIKRP
ncbi:DGQHR domain-containing protein [Rhizobiaceae bacterium BDR2-2]|uniref:DGQHR domain-containing protein n=1 Tax=Ectorhizobium quercum TaxID=2965071 RepID=A0AAE3N7H2_9HYPH|nr:DGQHR domain-containing protein [Ectorhizobium quercum]MCX8999992.1 DGQHR domain-containing protein [Ectorhizobium quercum]